MTTTLPLPAGPWALDQAHSSISFKVRHLGLTNVRGRFDEFTADLNVGEDLASTSFSANVDITSVDTNNADRDGHLPSTDFFSAEQHPEMTFTSESITDKGDGEYEATGSLTINGVTKPVTLDVEFGGTQANPGDGKERAGFYATTTVTRDDFGIDFNMPLGVDQVAIGKKIVIEIDAQFIKPD